MKAISRIVLACAVAALAGCGGSKESADETLTLYSGRNQSLVEPLLERFQEETGIKIHVKYGNSSQLAVAIQEEGSRSPADVFWAQDAGALGALSRAGLFETLSKDVIGTVPERFCDDKHEWVATSGRARLYAYSPERVDPSEYPASVFDLADPRWTDRVGWAPLNASFQAFVTAMRVTHGDDRTRAWLVAVKENGAKTYPKNTAIIEAIAAGEIDLGLPNHYYLLRFKHQDSDYPVEQRFFESGDIGNLVNVAGAGVLRSSRHKENAETFVRYLLSPATQQYFLKEVFEYPVIEGAFDSPSSVELNDLIELSPAVELNDLDELNETLQLLRETGLL